MEGDWGMARKLSNCRSGCTTPKLLMSKFPVFKVSVQLSEKFPLAFLFSHRFPFADNPTASRIRTCSEDFRLDKHQASTPCSRVWVHPRRPKNGHFTC
jgi:hypothetical protein